MACGARKVGPFAAAETRRLKDDLPQPPVIVVVYCVSAISEMVEVLVGNMGECESVIPLHPIPPPARCQSGFGFGAPTPGVPPGPVPTAGVFAADIVRSMGIAAVFAPPDGEVRPPPPLRPSGDTSSSCLGVQICSGGWW
jgi:hypothetical protein